MEIRCRKCDCVHNDGSACHARQVNICKDTAECATFAHDESKEGVTVGNGNLFNAAKNLTSKNARNVRLTCAAKSCLFNESRDCIANGICVIDDGATDYKCGASCSTYIED
jgi:hypothetical protein